MSNKNKQSITEQFKNAYREAYAIKPDEVIAQNNLRTDFYKSFLWRLFLGNIEIKVPDKWSIDFVRAMLFWGGGIGVTELKGAVVPFAYSILTRNNWHYPITVQATGMLANEIPKRTIGEDCEIVYLESADFPNCAYAVGVASYIEIYAEKLACCDASIDTNLFVTRTPYIFGCEDDKQVEDMKALIRRMMSGVPAIYYKLTRKANPAQKELPLLKIPAKENFISLDVQAAKRSIIDEFLTGIGINNANTDKRERLITSEVEANDAEISAAIALWQDNVTRCIDKVKALYADFFLDNDFYVKFGREQKGGNNELSRVNGNMETETDADDTTPAEP